MMTNRADDACVTLTLRLKVRPESYGWLTSVAVEVNQTWNFCNERAATVLGNLGRWLSGFDLCNETAGSTQYMKRIGADTIQRVCTEYAAKRNAVRNILARAKVLASVSGNEPSCSPVPPSRPYGRREAGTETARTAA